MSQEHAHETNAGQIDRALLLAILRQRNAELIPVHRFPVAVAQRHRGFADIGDEVMSQHHVFRADAHLILQVALILVERKVLVDVFYVREGLIGGVVALRLLVVVGRVALWHVDTLVTLQDARLTLVQVTSTEVVVVVVGWVVVPGCPHTVVDGHPAQEVRIGGIAALLFISQSVQSHILLGTGSAGGGKGVSLGGLNGNLTPLGR